MLNATFGFNEIYIIIISGLALLRANSNSMRTVIKRLIFCMIDKKNLGSSSFL